MRFERGSWIEWDSLGAPWRFTVLSAWGVHQGGLNFATTLVHERIFEPKPDIPSGCVRPKCFSQAAFAAMLVKRETLATGRRRDCPCAIRELESRVQILPARLI